MTTVSKPLPLHGPSAQEHQEQEAFEQALYEYVGIDPSRLAVQARIKGMMPSFYDVSQRLIEQCPNLFVKTQAHDPTDAESADLLWIALSNDASDLCEGEVIQVSHYQDLWFASHDHADKVGGWPTVWSVTGSADQVVEAVRIYLVSE